MFRKLRSWILGYKIRKGWAPHGRTISKSNRNTGQIKIIGTLSAKVIRKDGKVEDLGIIARKCVTTSGVNYLVDSFQDSTTFPMDVFKYHDSGTGIGAEDVGNTALETPCGEARDVGSQEEGASPNIFKTVAQHTYAGAFAITEHGLFSADTGGTLWDRSKFDPINVVANDKIEWTYELTCIPGG